MTDELRKKIMNDLTDIVLSAMERGDATVDDGKESAQVILGGIKVVNTKEDLLVFLENLKNRWKCYEPAYAALKAQSTQKDDENKIHEIQDKLNQLITT